MELTNFALQNQIIMWRDLVGIITRLLVATPNAWKKIYREKVTLDEFLYRYLHPIFGLIAFTSFVGELMFTPGGNFESALKKIIIAVVAVYGAFFISSYILNEMAEKFGLVKNMNMFKKFVGYSSVVIYLLYLIVPFFSNFIIIWLLGFYTVHLINIGAELYLKVDKSNKSNFSIISSAVILITPTAINLLFSILIK